MKASASLLFLFLVVAGCTERTTTPTELAPPDVVFGARAGNPPPPPADVAVAICVSGGGCAVFDGSYMSNGEAVAFGGKSIPIGFASFTAAAAQGDGVCMFPGHASLKIDGLIDVGGFPGKSSSNAQIKCRHQVASGNGTLEIGTVISLEHVDLFYNQADCTAECGTFIVRDEEGDQIAFGQVFEREFFNEFCDLGGSGAFCYGEG